MHQSSEGKDAFPSPSQSLKATKFLANPLPIIAVTQTAIMGVVSAPFSSNTKGALSTSPLIQPTAFLLFLSGAVTVIFPELQPEPTELRVNFMGLQPKTGQLQRLEDRSRITKTSMCPKKAKSGGSNAFRALFSIGYQVAGYANCGTIS